MHEVSLVRLYTLRLCYLILAVGLGLYMWPSVIHHTPDFAIAHGIQLSLLAGLGLTAVLPTCVRVTLVVRSPGQPSSCGGHPSLSDGHHFPSAHPLGLRHEALHHAARKPVESCLNLLRSMFLQSFTL
jgi:hypothetical protein